MNSQNSNIFFCILVLPQSFQDKVDGNADINAENDATLPTENRENRAFEENAERASQDEDDRYTFDRGSTILSHSGYMCDVSG